MSEEKLKWMYEGKNSSIDHEQYLLGKKITTLRDDDSEKGDFEVSQQQSSIATGNVTVLERLDYESKVREDPLFEIRKNDYDHRKELLSNPFKKKRITSMLKNALEKDLRKSSARNNRPRSDSSSSETSGSNSDSDSDDVSRKYVRKSLKDEKLRKALKEKLERDLKYSKKSEHREKEHVYQEKHRSSSYHHHKRRTDRGRSTSSSEGEIYRKAAHEERESKEKAKKAGFGLSYIKDGERKSVDFKPRKRKERKTPSPEPEKPKYVRKHKSGFSRKLTEEELEKKRKEMMENASWRDDQRKLNVKKFNLEEKKEKEREERTRLLKRKAEEKGVRVKDFIHDMKLHSASVGSMEDTVRRKKHTLSNKV